MKLIKRITRLCKRKILWKEGSKNKKYLIYACRTGDVATVEKLLNEGEDVDLRCNDISMSDEGKHVTLLMIAVWFNKKLVVDTLLKHGANVNAKNKQGLTALDFACEKENIEMARELIDSGASLNNISEKNMKFIRRNNKVDLEYACRTGDVATVEKLLNEGEDVDLRCNDKGDTLLMTAVNYNRKLVVDTLLKHGANVNAKNNRGNTALLIECCEYKEKYNDAIVKMLLNNGADVNISNVYGETALMMACSHWRFSAVKNLLGHKVSVNMRNVNGETALSITCQCTNSYDMVKELIDNGADVNAKDNRGKTPLLIACEYNKDANVKALLEYGAETEGKDLEGKTALDYACEKGNFKMAMVLIESGASLNNILKRNMQFLIENNIYKADLEYACRTGDVDTVEKLLNEGVNVDLGCNDEGDTLLMTAVNYNRKLVVDTLLKHGANVNAKNNRGNTALILACSKVDDNNDAIVKILLNNGADVNMRNVNGETALSITCQCTNTYDVVKELIDNGADVNAKDNRGKTPLLIACEYNKDANVKALLEYGAETEGKDLEGKTALDYACEKENIEMARELIDSGASLNNISEENMKFIRRNNKVDLKYACRIGDVATVEKLLNEEENVDLRFNDKGETLLMTAVNYNKELVVDTLLKHGANVNAKDDEGETALIWACRVSEDKYKDAIIKMLLNNRADINAKNNKGETALIWACRMPENKYNDAIVKMLLNNGADVNAKDNKENTALIHTIKAGNFSYVKDLLAYNANVNIRNSGRETALTCACRYYEGNYEVVKELIDNGADVNNMGSYGYTPLILACICDKKNIVIEELLNQNVDVNYCGKGEFTALTYLCKNNNYKMVCRIIECGADVNNGGGDLIGYWPEACSPLTAACEVNNIDMVKVLLEHGAKIDKKDRNGKTALDYICKKGNIEMTRALIDSGVSLNNISEREMRCIIENLSDYSITKILTAVLNRDSENIGGYLDEYFNKINKVTGLNKMSVPEYKIYIPKFYQVNNYIKSLKSSEEVKELREETKLLKEKIEKINKVGSTSEKLDEIKQKVHRNKMILKELRTFEMDIKDMLNVKILEPIYCRKQSIDFELK